MDSKWAVLLGGAPLNSGVVQRFREMKLKVALVDYRPDVQLDNDKHIVFDATSTEAANELRSCGIHDVEIVYTSMDDAGLAQREICKQYGLCYASEEAVLGAHSKNIMHKIWREHGLLNREFLSADSFGEQAVVNFNKKFPVVVKPSDACASRGVTLLSVNSAAEKLRKAFEAAKEFSSSGLVNIEEFVEGVEYTVEMCGDSYGNVCIYGISRKDHSANAGQNRVAVKLHYNSADVHENTMRALVDCGVKCYKALGLTSTLGHLEVIQKPDGTLSPIEIGARSSGFIASHLVDAVSGVCFLGEFRKVLHGKRLAQGLYPQTDQSSMYFFYDFPPGKISRNSLNLMQFAPELTCHYYDRKNLVAGKFFSQINQDTERYGCEVLSGPKSILTATYIQNVEKRFLEGFLCGQDELA